MQRTSFDFDVITGPSAKKQEDQRQPSERNDWNIAASLRTADATQSVRTTTASDVLQR